MLEALRPYIEVLSGLEADLKRLREKQSILNALLTKHNITSLKAISTEPPSVEFELLRFKIHFYVINLESSAVYDNVIAQLKKAFAKNEHQLESYLENNSQASIRLRASIKHTFTATIQTLETTVRELALQANFSTKQAKLNCTIQILRLQKTIEDQKELLKAWENQLEKTTKCDRLFLKYYELTNNVTQIKKAYSEFEIIFPEFERLFNTLNKIDASSSRLEHWEEDFCHNLDGLSIDAEDDFVDEEHMKKFPDFFVNFNTADSSSSSSSSNSASSSVVPPSGERASSEIILSRDRRKSI